MARAGTNSTEAYYSLALINVRLNQVMQAQENFKKVLSFDPSHWSSIKNLAKLYHNMGKHSQAAEVLGQLPTKELSLRDNVIYLDILGESYISQGSYTKATQLYQRVLQHDPEHANAIIALGKYHSL